MRISTVIIGRWVLSTGFTCAIVINTKAQATASGNNHTLTAGAGIQVLKDDALSLPSESLSSTSLAWSFSNSNGYRKKSILAGFERGSGNSAKESLHSNEFMLRYTNAFSLLKNKSGRWNNYTGYSISINPQYIKAGDQYSWASVNSLSVYNSLERSWQKSILSLDIFVPLAGLGSRPGINTTYKGSVNDMLYNSFSNLAFTSLHNLKAVNISIQYQQAVSGRLSVTAGASYSYKDMTINYRFLQQAYEVHAGLSYQVK
jgi:hypothetical protein